MRPLLSRIFLLCTSSALIGAVFFSTPTEEAALPLTKAPNLPERKEEIAPPKAQITEAPSNPKKAELQPAPAEEKKTISPEPHITPQDIEVLLALEPQMPIDDLAPLSLDESFREERSGGRKHKAVDMTAPRGKPIHAVVDGVIEDKGYNPVGGRCVYQKDTNGDFMFFYAHLSRYEEGLAPGKIVKKGDIIGYVGDTGNAKGHPHLHFAITKLLTPEDRWTNAIVNPYYIFTKKPYPFRKK